MTYWGFLRAAFKAGSEKGILRLLLLVSEIAGVLGLFGVGVVLVDVDTVPAWVTGGIFLASTAGICLIGMHGAYGLWKESDMRVRRAAADIAVAQDRSPSAVVVRWSNRNHISDADIQGPGSVVTLNNAHDNIITGVKSRNIEPPSAQV